MNLITLTGPSCSGKTTLLNELVDKHGFASIVSHTTRPMRPGELSGRDYYFADQKEFDNILKGNGFIEAISFNGYSYGVSAGELTRVTCGGQTAVLIVEPNGLGQIKRYAAENGGFNMFSVYVDGEVETLLARYISRLAGEDLKDPKVAARHGLRVKSLVNECKEWYPHIESNDYDLILGNFDATNQDIVIEQLKNIQW